MKAPSFLKDLILLNLFLLQLGGKEEGLRGT